MVLYIHKFKVSHHILEYAAVTAVVDGCVVNLVAREVRTMRDKLVRKTSLVTEKRHVMPLKKAWGRGTRGENV